MLSLQIIIAVLLFLLHFYFSSYNMCPGRPWNHTFFINLSPHGALSFCLSCLSLVYSTSVVPEKKNNFLRVVSSNTCNVTMLTRVHIFLQNSAKWIKLHKVMITFYHNVYFILWGLIYSESLMGTFSTLFNKWNKLLIALSVIFELH